VSFEVAGGEDPQGEEEAPGDGVDPAVRLAGNGVGWSKVKIQVKKDGMRYCSGWR
jgi:hypothetical protein